VHLLPNYDEYLIAYKDHSPMVDVELQSRAGDAFMAHIIVLNGQVVGGWRRVMQKNEIIITTKLLVKLDKVEQYALQLAAERYSRFLGLPVRL
jgi:hypothetical protein